MESLVAEICAIAERFGVQSEDFREQLSLTLTRGTPTWTGDIDADDVDAVALPSERYQIRQTLGVGGMGEVREAEDRRLSRTVAMKVSTRGAGERLVREARITAGLEHPSIIPVHDLGHDEDGRPFYTMKVIRGRTLRASIVEAYSGVDTSWTLHRLVDVFRRVCEAVAFAHSRGVVHCDLKPHNIMTGDFGEVLVVDWGLAARTGQDGVIPGTHQAGTPAYMAPEQVTGAAVGSWSDVWSLGAVLHEVLAGAAPFTGPNSKALMSRVIMGTRDPLPETVPDELAELVDACMRTDAEDRPDASTVAARVVAWQEGARATEIAMERVERADDCLFRAAALRREATAERALARIRLRDVPASAPEQDRYSAWDLQDEASLFEAEADKLEVRGLQLLRSALEAAPQLEPAHDRLADHYRTLHAEAERARDDRAAARYETLLRAHDTGRHSAWLNGTGTWQLQTDPRGATVSLYRFVQRRRRLVREPVDPGRTQLRGSYVAEVSAPGFATAQVPFVLARTQRLSLDVRLLPAADLGPDEVYVPAGPFRSGGDPLCPYALPDRDVHVDAFVMGRFPVTNRDYIAFLDALVDSDDEASALAHVPRERGSGEGEEARMVYGRDDDGHFVLQPDAEGDMWEPGWPVCLIDQQSAQAYAAWKAETTGKAWRLPSELEWEKAARGVDGRWFPWGDSFDPSRCRTREGQSRPLPCDVEEYPLDVSVYGVRGTAGNMRVWCADLLHDDDIPKAITRGGHWFGPPEFARCADRYWLDRIYRSSLIGFRVARSV